MKLFNQSLFKNWVSFSLSNEREWWGENKDEEEEPLLPDSHIARHFILLTRLLTYYHEFGITNCMWWVSIKYDMSVSMIKRNIFAILFELEKVYWTNKIFIMKIWICQLYVVIDEKGYCYLWKWFNMSTYCLQRKYKLK